MYSPRFADLKWLTLTISLLKLANDDIIEAIAWFLVTLYLARYFNNLNNTPHSQLSLIDSFIKHHMGTSDLNDQLDISTQDDDPQVIFLESSLDLLAAQQEANRIRVETLHSCIILQQGSRDPDSIIYILPQEILNQIYEACYRQIEPFNKSKTFIDRVTSYYPGLFKTLTPTATADTKKKLSELRDEIKPTTSGLLNYRH